MEFDNNVLEKIKFIIQQYGRSICDEQKRFSSLLMDLCPGNHREVNLLLTALREGVVGELFRNSQPSMTEALCNRLSQKLIADHGISDDAAQWAVRGWANVLGFGIAVKPINYMSQINNQANTNVYPQFQSSQNNSQGNNAPPPIINPNISSISNPPTNKVLNDIQSWLSRCNIQNKSQYSSNNAIKGLNWGGFVFPLFWGLSNRVKYAWVALIPYVGLIVSIVYLIYGNQLAWNSDRQWRDIDEFKLVQKIWAKWALYTVIILVVIYSIIGILTSIGMILSNSHGY